MFTLEDLANIRSNRNTSEERAQIDRDMYLRGRRMYPTTPEEGLPQGFTSRDKGCYMMGYNMTERENGHG